MRYLLCLVLAGCVSLPPVELAWQALHAVDTVQTLKIARNPDRYWEAQSASIIGSHPSERSVLAFMVGSAIVHAQCARWLNGRHPRLFTVFEAASLGMAGRNVYVNARIGL